MKQEIEKVSLEFDAEIKSVESQAQLEELRVKYLGKSGKITALMPMMKTVPNEKTKDVHKTLRKIVLKFIEKDKEDKEGNVSKKGSETM